MIILNNVEDVNFIRKFLMEMYESQKNGSLNSFVLDNKYVFLEQVINDDHLEFDRIVDISSKLSDGGDVDIYNSFIEDFLSNKYKVIDEYLGDNDEQSILDEIEILKESLELNIKENNNLKEEIKKSQALVMEVLDMMIN